MKRTFPSLNLDLFIVVNRDFSLNKSRMTNLVDPDKTAQRWVISSHSTLLARFVCHYWQWPILIICVNCYYLCVLRWLMRPILALNCILKIEQERSEKESHIGDALALAFRCACFCSASLIRFAPYSPALLLMRPRHFVRSCAICSHNDVQVFWPPWERFPTCSSP